MSEQIERQPSHEWTKFIILLVILMGTIVVVALIRPYIFNHVVPVVMGEGQISDPTSTDAEQGEVESEEMPVDDTAVEEEPGMTDEETPVEAEGEMAGEALPTAVPSISHTVQQGETIIKIALRYGVTVGDIVAANNLSNPNHIEVGVTLLIPQP